MKIILIISNFSLQQRIPNETLSGLASALADGPIFEIVDGLTEVQQAVEKQLFRQRLEMLKRHSGNVYNIFCSIYLSIDELMFNQINLLFIACSFY